MRTRIIALLLLMLLSIAACAASAQTGRKSLALSNFGTQDELARFAMKGLSSPDVTLNPGGGARLLLEKSKPGIEGFPSLTLSAGKGLPSEWRGYDDLAVDVRNDSPTRVDFGLTVLDARGGSAVHHFPLAPGESETVRFPFGQMSGVNLDQIQEIHIFAARPAEDAALVINNLRLEEDLDGRLSAIRESIDGFRKEARRTDAEGVLNQDSADVDRLQRTLNRAASGDSREALRPQIAVLEDGLRQMPRTLSEARMRTDFRKIDPAAPYACGFATSMVKIFPVEVPFQATVARFGAVELAGNETESLQVLILAGKQPLNGVRVSVGSLTRTDGKATLPASSVPASPVGFVKTAKPSYKVDYVGWYPDPILDFLKTFDIKAGEMQPVWVRVTTPLGTPAGEYRGEITVQPANAPAVKLGLRVKVWGFDVPQETHLRTAVSFRDNMLPQVYGVDSEEMRQRYCAFLLKYRINPDNIYRYSPPKVSDLIRWNKMGMNAFNITYAVKPADLKPNAPYPADKKAVILAQLDAIIPQLKANGLYQKAYVYGFDEINPDSYAAMKDIFGAIKAKYPDLLLMTTGRDPSYGVKTGLSMVDAWVPLTPAYDLKRADEVRAQGKQVWWYICIVPQAPYANFLIEYPAIDARVLMGLQTAKYKPDGFLYYAVDRWPLSKKPITSGPYTDWNPQSLPGANGDGSFLCAGPDGPLATIRMENIRDGIEDNEYFWLLNQEITKLKANVNPGAEAALRQAEKAADIGPDVVQDMTHFTKSPEALLAKRRQVAEAILAARKVTEKWQPRAASPL